MVKRILGLVVCAVVLYGVAPAVLQVLNAWPEVVDIKPYWFAAMIAAQVLSWAGMWLLQRLSVDARSWWPIVTSQLASGAFGRVVPGGAAAAGALQYGMLVQAGVSASLAGLGVGRLWIRIGTRLRKKHPPPADLPERLRDERDLVRRALGKRWWEAVAGAAGRWLFDWLTLLTALAAVDQHPRPSLVLLAFCAAQLLAQIPITPGGLGVVEAGLTGTLVLIGVPAGAAAVATLAYRLVSYWLALPAGGGAWLYHRRRVRAGHVSLPRLAAPG